MGTSRLLRNVVIVVAVALGSQGLLPSPADALPTERVSCGVPIQHSLRVANNLSCPDDGLVVGASGITIDLGGHRIVGDGSGDGVTIANPYHHVTVRNGVVSGFNLGVTIQNSHHNVVEDIIARGNEDGIFIVFAESNILRRNTATNNLENGIFVWSESPNNQILKNVATSNGDDGFVLYGATDTLLAGNLSVGNTDRGIYLFAGTTGNTVSGNKVRGNGTDGIVVDISPGNTLVGNTSSGNGFSGFYLVGSNLNVLRENVANANGGTSSAGIYLANADDNRLKANALLGNAGDGIHVDAAATGNVIRGNNASENDGDGINAVAPASISRNTANRNGFPNGVDTLADANNQDTGAGLGISAAGSTGSANTARGNDDLDECIPTTLCSG